MDLLRNVKVMFALSTNALINTGVLYDHVIKYTLLLISYVGLKPLH